jgi:hypothetical protein
MTLTVFGALGFGATVGWASARPILLRTSVPLAFAVVVVTYAAARIWSGVSGLELVVAATVAWGIRQFFFPYLVISFKQGSE